MSDPVGLIGSGGVDPTRGGQPGRQQKPAESGGPAFKDVLFENLRNANELEQDATRAIEDLQAGRRTDVEGVLLAAQKADMAFQALQAVRNKVVEAYQEIQQMRT